MIVGTSPSRERELTAVLGTTHMLAMHPMGLMFGSFGQSDHTLCAPVHVVRLGRALSSCQNCPLVKCGRRSSIGRFCVDRGNPS
jgi:hypothetical protein